MNNGGVERGCVEVANYLAACGHRSLVLSAGGTMVGLLASGVEHISLPVGKKSWTAWFLIKKLRTLFVDYKVDVVHARSRLPAWLAFLAIKKIKQHKPKFITTVHGLYSVKKYSSIMARGDEVVAVSMTALHYVKKHYAKYLRTEPTLIYRGIDPAQFAFGHDPDILWMHKFYQDFHQLVGHKMVLMAGRLTALKGAKDLLPWLKSKDNDAKLVFTADPAKDLYAAKLYHFFKQEKVDHRIIWIGVQQNMADLYAVAHVVVSASQRPESFGRTVLEALAVGTPVVAYEHGGVGEILQKMFPEGRVEVRNSQQLADKINAILAGHVEMTAAEPFLLDDMLSQTLSLYRQSSHV